MGEKEEYNAADEQTDGENWKTSPVPLTPDHTGPLNPALA